MMRSAILSSLFFFLAGCEFISVHTNIPFFYGHSFEIVNTTNYDLTVSVSGRPSVFRNRETGEKMDRLAPTQSGAIYFRNYSGYGAEASVTIKAWQGEKLVGAASRQVYIYYNYQQADVWLVRGEDFAQSYAYRW